MKIQKITSKKNAHMIVDILFQKGFMRINRVDNIYKVDLKLNNNNQKKKQNNKEENKNSFEEKLEKEKTLIKKIRRKF